MEKDTDRRVQQARGRALRPGVAAHACSQKTGPCHRAEIGITQQVAEESLGWGLRRKGNQVTGTRSGPDWRGTGRMAAQISARMDRHLRRAELGCLVGDIGPFTTRLGTCGMLEGEVAMLVHRGPLCHLEKDALLWVGTASARAQSRTRDVSMKSPAGCPGTSPAGM